MDPSSRKVTPKKQRPNTAVKKRKRPRQSRISIDVDNIDPEILQNPGGSMEPQENRVNNSSIISDPELYRNIGGSVEAAELVPNFSALDTEAELFRKIDASILEDKKSHNAITPKIGGKARSVDFTTPTNRRPTTAGNKRTKTQAFRFSSEIRSNNRENATDNEEKGVKVIPRKRFKLRENSQQMPTLLASVQRTPTSSSQTSSVSRGRFRSVDNHHQMPILCQIRTPKSTYTPSHGASVRSSYRPSHHTSAQQSQDHKTPEIRPKDPKLGKLIKSYNMSYFAMMGEYWRNGLDEGTKVFIHKGHDEYIRRALVARGWYENKEKNSIAYHLKWFSTDLGFDYEKIHPDQTYNHILGNRALTTKTGLNTCFRSVTTYGSHIDEFYPRCYDLSDKQQRKEFVQDYESTAVQSIVTNHAYYFSDTTTDSIEVNVLCLRHAILYCKSLIATNICENQSRHEFMQRNEAPGDWKYTWKSLIKYSKIVPPFDEDTFDKLDTCHQYEVEDVWMIPDQGLISDWLDTAQKMLQMCPQLRIDRGRNVWIVKPGQSTKGSGVHWIENKISILKKEGASQNRVVQKYIEIPMLIKRAEDHYKFDISLYVFVSRLEPLKIYVFNSWYFRLCSSPHSLDNLSDLSQHSPNIVDLKKKYDEENFMSLAQFFEHINEDEVLSWQQKTVPLIHRLIIETLLAAEDSLQQKTGCSELFGFDITLDQWMHPWLLDVNLSPAWTERAPWLTEMTDSMATGLMDILLEPSAQPDDPLYSVDLEPQRCAKTGSTEWEYLYKGDWAHLDQPKLEQLDALKIRGTKANLKLEKKMEKNYNTLAALAPIQRNVRGFLVRCMMWHRKRRIASTMMQKYIRRFLAIIELKRRRSMAASCLITRFFRTTQDKEAVDQLKRTHLATFCKKIHKGKKVRKTYKELLRKFLTEQIVRRGKIVFAKQEVSSLRKERFAVAFAQKYWRQRFAAKIKVANKVQARVRGFIGRKKFAEIKEYNRQRKIIQCAIFGYWYRQIHLIRVQKMKIEAEKVHAQTIVAYWQMKQTKKYITMLKKHKALQKFNRIYRETYAILCMKLLVTYYNSSNAAVLCIQTHARGLAARQDFKQRLFEKKQLEIQKSIRLWLARKKFKRIQYEFRRYRLQQVFWGFMSRKRMGPEIQRCKAATRIQRGYRLFKVWRFERVQHKIEELHQEWKKRKQSNKLKKVEKKALLEGLSSQNVGMFESHKLKVLENSQDSAHEDPANTNKVKKAVKQMAFTPSSNREALKIKHKVVRSNSKQWKSLAMIEEEVHLSKEQLKIKKKELEDNTANREWFKKTKEDFVNAVAEAKSSKEDKKQQKDFLSRIEEVAGFRDEFKTSKQDFMNSVEEPFSYYEDLYTSKEEVFTSFDEESPFKDQLKTSQSVEEESPFKDQLKTSKQEFMNTVEEVSENKEEVKISKEEFIN